MTEPIKCFRCGTAARSDGARCPRCGAPSASAAGSSRSRRRVLRQGHAASSPSPPATSVPATPQGFRRPVEATWATRPKSRWSDRRTMGLVLAVAILAGGVGIAAVLWRHRHDAGIDARAVVPDGVLHAAQLYADLGRPMRTVEAGFLLGDADGAIAVEVVPPEDDLECEIVLEPSALSDRSVWSGTLGRRGRIHAIRPRIAWRGDALRGWRRPDVVEFVGTVRVGDRTVPLRRAVRVRSIAEASLLDPRTFAALINEDHAWIDPILREGIDHGVVDRYELMDDQGFEGTVANVFSVWTAMRRRGIVYGNVAVTSDSTTQRVRTLDEVIRNRQANCVDGSVAVASIPAALVVRPDHMLLAFRPCRECRWVGLETTMISQDGSVELRHPEMGSLRARYGGPRSGHAEDWSSFETALVSGDLELPENPDESESMLRIDELRDSGMIPVPSSGAIGPLPTRP